MGRNLPGGRGGLHERQQRQHAIGGVLRENELFHAGTAENFFHSFKIHALLRDVLGLLVLLEEREEAVGFALGVADTGSLMMRLLSSRALATSLKASLTSLGGWTS